jgi:hypothetical protein
MKSDIDLADHKVKWAIRVHENLMKKALEVPQTVESAVFPIYHTIRSVTKPEQIGSGVLVCIKQEYFIFSASHIFDQIGERQMLIALVRKEKLFSLTGERFSTKKGPSGYHRDDPIDASVFHIQQPLPSKVKNLAIGIDDLDLAKSEQSHSVFMAAGFRVKKSRTVQNKANAQRECFPTMEYSQKEYSLLNINNEIHIALAYEDKTLVNGSWQKSPIPRGFSGGAIIKVDGISMSIREQDKRNPKQVLSAITIEYRRENHGKPGVLIGTRIEVYLKLIDHFLPALR